MSTSNHTERRPSRASHRTGGGRRQLANRSRSPEQRKTKMSLSSDQHRSSRCCVRSPRQRRCSIRRKQSPMKRRYSSLPGSVGLVSVSSLPGSVGLVSSLPGSVGLVSSLPGTLYGLVSSLLGSVDVRYVGLVRCP